MRLSFNMRLGTGVVASVLVVMGVYFWSVQPSAPFVLYAVHCRIIGGEAIDHVENGYGRTTYHSCKSKIQFTDAGKICERNNDCQGTCEMALDDASVYKVCTNNLY